MLIYIISNRLQPHISDPHSSYNPQSNSSNLVVLILISLSRPSQRHQLAPRKPWYLKRISDLDESFDSKLIVLPIRWIKKKERKKERKNERWLGSSWDLPNDVRAVIFTSVLLNVRTLRGNHYKHIKPLWTLSEDFLLGLAHFRKT